MLLAKLDVFGDELEARTRVARRYDERLRAACPALTLPHVDQAGTSVYAQYTLQGGQRDRIVAGLRDRGIPTAVYYPEPLHRQPAFAGRARVAGGAGLPVTDRLAARVFSVPMHPYLDEPTQDRVVDAVATVTRAL